MRKLAFAFLVALCLTLLDRFVIEPQGTSFLKDLLLNATVILFVLICVDSLHRLLVPVLGASIMLKMDTTGFVFFGGFAIMVLEIIGQPYLAKDFGGSFYVWVSQIGVILIALALGYAIGGALADRFGRAGLLAIPLAVAGLFTMNIPTLTGPLVEKIIMRHPSGEDIPLIWQKLDPVLGSGLVFFLPCFVLALLSPYTVRLAARRMERVGTVSGMIYSASTVGSIAGVFVAGYIFMGYLAVTTIFSWTGGLILFLGAFSLMLDGGSNT